MYEAVHMLSMVRVCDIPWHMLHQTFPNNLNYCYLKNGGENIKILWFSVHQHFTGTSWPMMYERYIELSWLKLKMVNHHANIILTISYVMKAQREKKNNTAYPLQELIKSRTFLDRMTHDKFDKILFATDLNPIVQGENRKRLSWYHPWQLGTIRCLHCINW